MYTIMPQLLPHPHQMTARLLFVGSLLLCLSWIVRAIIKSRQAEQPSASSISKGAKRIQFICKKNECYGFQVYSRRSAGLYNSTHFIVDALKARGIEAEIIEVTDNNDIDREVTRFKPDIVVIEALWVVPEKFPVLMELHPNVKWHVHLHSHMPFLALEGISICWISAYAQMGVGLIANSRESYEALRSFVAREEIVHLENVYIPDPKLPAPAFQKNPAELYIGCFGAVRPLKNQLIQAMAALEYGYRHKTFVNFYVNASRVETGGEPVLKSLRDLFAVQPQWARLVESKWNTPEEFLSLLQCMDVGMQVSLTETFNVVTADYVTAGIPVVVSKEVAWASDRCKARDNNMNDIVHVMERVMHNDGLVRTNRALLEQHSKRAQEAWFEFCVNA